MRETWRGFKLLIASSFKAAPWVAAIGLTFEPLGATISALTALYYKWLIDGISNSDPGTVRTAAIAIAATTAANVILRYFGWPLRTRLLEETGSWLDARVLKLHSSMPGLEHTERPEYHDRMQSLEGGSFASGIMDVVGGGAGLGRIVLLLGLLGSIHPVLMLLPLAGIPSVIIGMRMEKIGAEAWHDTRPTWALSNSFYELCIRPGPAKEVRVFGLADELRRRQRAARDEGIEKLRKVTIQVSIRKGLGWAIFALGYLAALGFVAVEARNGRASLGDLVLAITVAAQMNDAVQLFAGSLSEFSSRMWNAKHFLWLEDEAARVAKGGRSIVPSKLEDGIRFENVSFTYPGTERPVLEDVNLLLPAGSRVAVVGDNGAGKTTLVKLLGGFYQPTSGRILVDGIDLSQMDTAAWRERLSAGFQDYCRFELRASRTVGIGDLPRLDEDPAITKALNRAGAADVAGKLAKGLETQLGRSFDEGVDLSMGQWQKLALGRAFMREDPLLLVLDEPTSSLDAPTEHALFSRYAAVAEERVATGGITLLVSHRFSTVRTADMIIVVEGGRVREIGNHDQLMASEGLYAELFTLQASAYR